MDKTGLAIIMSNMTNKISDFAQHMEDKVKISENRSMEQPENRNIRAALEYLWFHKKRWIRTFNSIAPHIEKNARILEVGGLSDISYYLRENSCHVDGTTGNLCYPLQDLSNDSYDAVLCLEVIEHIKDQEDSSPLDEFNLSGASCLASEMFRVLSEKGVLVCTTPNGNSYAQLARIALGEAPAFHRGHVREYTVPELQALFEGVGFETISIETPAEIWGVDPKLDVDAAKAYVTSVGGSHDFREEDIIAVFRKP